MLRDRLGKELLFFDGGMGTLLQDTENITKREVTLYLPILLEPMH